jgi:7-cyano-7-deazaguanine synthase in queuosine biosynthesis
MKCARCKNDLGTGDMGWYCRSCMEILKAPEYVLKSELVKAESEVTRLRAIIGGLECTNRTWHNPKGAMCGICQSCRAKAEAKKEGK